MFKVQVAKDHLAEPDPGWNAPTFLAKRETKRLHSYPLEARLRQDPHLFPSPRPCPMLPRACHAITMGTKSLPLAFPGPQTYFVLGRREPSEPQIPAVTMF